MPAKIYLASRSPRRRELLTQAGLPFRVYVPREEELPAPGHTRQLSPAKIVITIAKAKACAAVKELAAKKRQSGLVLAADTLVFLDGKVLGKPANPKEAVAMLRRLSGRTHEVHTGVAVARLDQPTAPPRTVSVRTKVTFFPLTADWLRWYVGTGEPLDKAGAYGAQGHGSAMIRSFQGSYTNVVGLPLGEALQLLAQVAGAPIDALAGRR